MTKARALPRRPPEKHVIAKLILGSRPFPLLRIARGIMTRVSIGRLEGLDDLHERAGQPAQKPAKQPANQLSWSRPHSLIEDRPVSSQQRYRGARRFSLRNPIVIMQRISTRQDHAEPLGRQNVIYTYVLMFRSRFQSPLGY